MEGISDFAGNLKMELLNVREELRRRTITEKEAQKRVLAIRRRRLSGDGGYRRMPQIETGVLQLQRN